MVSREEIEKLASLARIEISEKEAEKLSGEIDAILGYVNLVGQIHPDPKASGLGQNSEINVLREDENPTESESFNKELIAEFPKAEKNYLKVKKIL